MSESTKGGLKELDPWKLERACLRLGLSKTEISNRTGLSRNTINRAFEGDGVQSGTVVKLAKVLKFDDPNELLRSSPSPQSAAATEWEVVEYLGPWLTCSNTIQFRICRMRHKYVAERFGRGKCYDLLNPTLPDSERINDHLLRHPTVCARVGPHPHIADNLAAYPGPEKSNWWVVDRWIGSETLADQLRNGCWEPSRTPTLAWQTALGLKALHDADVVFRELAPARILFGQEHGEACLTDFELAKLLENAPTVSSDWEDDPFRAPEVENGRASKQSDLFSWAQIVTASLTNTKADAIPTAVQKLLRACLSPGPSKRPDSIDDVIQVLRKAWPEATGENSR